MDRFYMVLGANEPTHRHATQFEAEQEADRLASLNPGKRFYVLRSVGWTETHKMIRGCVDGSNTTHWGEDIPF